MSNKTFEQWWAENYPDATIELEHYFNQHSRVDYVWATMEIDGFLFDSGRYRNISEALNGLRDDIARASRQESA